VVGIALADVSGGEEAGEAYPSSCFAFDLNTPVPQSPKFEMR
jgi:hypothetical protein